MTPDLTLSIDPHDPTPPFEQLRRQLVGHIRSGRLAGGARLPPVRQLASDLGLAAGTVARSYRELEADGWLVTRRGGGTRVGDAWRDATDDLDAELSAVAQRAISEARALGATDEQVRAALDAALTAPAEHAPTADAADPRGPR